MRVCGLKIGDLLLKAKTKQGDGPMNANPITFDD